MTNFIYEYINVNSIRLHGKFNDTKKEKSTTYKTNGRLGEWLKVLSKFKII